MLARIRQDSPYAPRSLLDGASGIALVRVTSKATFPSLRVRHGVTSLGCVLGSGPTVPDTLDFKCPPDCLPGIAVGDTLMIPTRPGQDAQTLTARGFCPEALRVRCGYLPSLGVSFGDIERALELGSNGVEVRRRIARPR
jgi:hypothetical protein